MIDRKIKMLGMIILFFALITIRYALFTSEVQAWEWPWQKETILKTEKKKLKNMDYEELIQRNLELRKEVLTMEKEKKARLQERNTLIMHIKELQKEKDNLAKAAEVMRTTPEAFKKWQIKIDGVNKRLDAVTKDRDRLQRELDKAKEKLVNLDKIILEEVQKQVVKTRLERTELFKSLEKDKLSLQDEVQRLKRILEKKEKEIKKLRRRK